LHYYAYCENNPVNCVDPKGTVPWLAVGAAIILTGIISGIIADELSEFFNAPGGDHLVVGEIGIGASIIAPSHIKLVLIWLIVTELTIAITDAFEAFFGDVDLIFQSPGIAH